MEDQFFSSFIDETLSIKTAAVVPAPAPLLESAGKSIGQFVANLKRGWKGGATLHGTETQAGKGIGGAYQHAKHGIQQAWENPAARRGLKAAGGLALGAVGLGGAGYLHGRLSSPNVTINRGY